ncbi:AI-2E family transporter [Bergeyella sp. RCAD1439]|uniref:AI-2E family transporter n=1 Tax=Bergeyella anatis TaxID=3113737 RepID=UPI002E17D15C|nr:AI-2E family transporter [Bergeyella sp. RCAD1439]
MQKSLVFSVVFVSVSLLAYLFVEVFNLLLMVFAGLLVGVLFIALAKKIQRLVRMPYLLALTISVLAYFSFIGGLFYLVGDTLHSEVDDFVKKIPEIKANVESRLEGTTVYGWVKDQVEEGASDSQAGTRYFTKFFSSTFGVFGDLYAVIFIGLFFAVSPKEYFKGAVILLPEEAKKKGEQVLMALYINLKTWLKSQLLEMLIMFGLTAVALLLVGLDYWLVLALITALFCFIPNIGPMIALVPMVAVGLLQEPMMALWVFLAFMGVQLLETGFIGPYIRKKMLSLPPALVLFVQLVLGATCGMIGVLLATPLLVVIIVLVQKLYLGRSKDEI